MKNRRMLLQALVCFVLVFSLTFPASLASASLAPAHVTDERSVIHPPVDSSSSASAILVPDDCATTQAAIDATSYYVVNTRILEPGDDLIHGFAYYGGYLWAATRTSPGRILKIDPVTLDYEKIILDAGLDDGEDLIAADGYIWVILYTNPGRIIRVDPSTLTWEVAVTFQSSELSYGGSLEYAFGYLWAGGRDRKLAKIDLSDLTYEIYSYTDIVSDSQFHGLTSGGGYIWGSLPHYSWWSGWYASTIVRINPYNPSDYSSLYIEACISDDIAYFGDYLYAGSEWAPSYAYRFADDLTYSAVYSSATGSYGMFTTGGEGIWGAYIGSPGLVIEFDTSLNIETTYQLPSGFDNANEIAFDAAGNMYVTCWQSPARIVKFGLTDSFADLGNPDDEATHNLVGWGDAQGPPENPFVSPSGDRTKRYMLLRGDNSLDLGVPEVAVPYLLITEVEDGHCTDNFEIYVNGQGPLYCYTGTNAGTGNIAAIRHQVLVPQEYITGSLVTVTFRNTATDDCGLAAVYNVRLQRAAQDDAKFVADVTIPDGTVVQPGEEFVKTWRLRNIGATTWTTDYKLVFDGGDQMGAPQHVNLNTMVPPNATVDISVPMTAPLSGGAKKGYLRMENPSGLRFGHTVWVEVFVPYTPTPELQEAIDNLYDTTMQRLEWLKTNMQTAAEHGDFFREQVASEAAALAMTLVGGFVSIRADIKDTAEYARYALRLAQPGMDIASHGWSDLMNLRQNYDVAKYLFSLTWQDLLAKSPEALNREILSQNWMYYASILTKTPVEVLGPNEALDILKEKAGWQDCFSEVFYPCLVSAIDMAEQHLTQVRDELLSSLPSLSPEEQEAYAADLNSRAKAARNLYVSSTHTVSTLSEIRSFYTEDWLTRIGLAVAKLFVRVLATALDGPGKLLVDGFLTAFDGYVHGFKLNESQQMVARVEGVIENGIATSNKLHWNAFYGMKHVQDSISPQVVTGRIESISHYSEGYDPWQPWTDWVETGSYSLVSVTNDSTEPATFHIVASYCGDYKAIFGIETCISESIEPEVVEILPGETIGVRLNYKHGSSGSSPAEGTYIYIYVFGSNDNGTFWIDTQSTNWNPQLVSQATGQRVSSFSVAEDGEEIEITENPVYVFLSALPDDLIYEVQTWVTNPVAENATATIVQDIPEDWDVLSAPGASSNTSQLVWELELEEGGLAQVSFTFAYHGDLSLDIVVPGPIVTLETPEGEPLGELIGNSPSLEPILPITGSVTMPVEVMPSDQATVSVDLLNLSEDTAEGDIIVSVTDPSGSCAYNQAQAFSLTPAASAVLDYVLPAFSEKGLYKVLTEISYGGVTRVMWRDVLRVGIMALEVSLNATPADRVYPGDTITYTVSLNNTSACDLNGVTAEAIVPADTVAHNISDDGQFEESMVKWQLLDPLLPGGTVELSFQAMIMPDAIGPGEARSIKSTALAASEEAFPVGSNEVRVLLVANPAPVMGTIVGDVDLYEQMDDSGVLVTVNGTYITTTAYNGSFAIDVPGGTHNVTFTCPGFHSVVYDSVTVVAGEKVSLPPVVLTPIETVEVQLSLKAGWNMVSVPVMPAGNSTSAVFPDVAGIFAWNAASRSYYVPTVIDPEKGYWVAVTEDTTITISGTPIETWTTDIKAGWNMIGSVYAIASITDPNDDPDGSVIPTAYWWDPVSKSYILTTDIEPGKGYWVASLNDCTLTL